VCDCLRRPDRGGRAVAAGAVRVVEVEIEGDVEVEARVARPGCTLMGMQARRGRRRGSKSKSPQSNTWGETKGHPV
jgi:hypothetical protein